MSTHGINLLFAFAALGLGLAPVSQAANVPLQNATATYSQTNSCCIGLWDPFKTIDGIANGAFTSWGIARNVEPSHAETIVWETQTDLTLGNR